MPWYAPWTNVIKKKVCRFLLQRYLGQFLEEKLSLDQLNVDFYNGTGTVYDVTLYCQALNDLCEGQGWGVEVICGHIGAVTVNIPYEAPLAKDSSIEVTNLSISLRPKARVTDGTSMFESMWSSMSSSMQLAQECLEREGSCSETPSTAPVNTIEGLEKFAQIIDNVLNRIKARLVNTEIRIEYLPPDSDSGVALIVKIKSIDYQNEAGNDPPDRQDTASSEDSSNTQQQSKQKSFLISTHVTHHISMEGITFYTEEFRIHNPRQQRRQHQSSSLSGNCESAAVNEQFLSTISDLPDPSMTSGATGTGNEFFSYTNACDNSSNSNSFKRTDSMGSATGASSDCDENQDDYIRYIHSGEILIGKLTSKQVVRVRMKQADNLSGPNVELEMSLGCFQLFLSPRQLHAIILLSDTFLGMNETPTPVKLSPPDTNTKQKRYEDAEFEFKHNTGRMSGGIGLNQGWSIADPMQTMIQEQAEFLGSDFREDRCALEMIESSNSSMTSSLTSSSMASRTTSASRRRMIDPDADADISKFNVRVAAMAIVLLHEDILVESSRTNHMQESPLSEASVQKLQDKADQFFRSVGNLGLGLGANDILNAGLIMDSGCDCNHLRLLMAPIIVEGEEQRNQHGTVLRFSVSIARADFREILTDASVPLIEFYREKGSSALPKRPEIIMNFKQTCNALKGSSGKRFAPPKLELRFSVASFLSEFDITILDRLSSLFYQFPFAAYYNQTTPVNSPESPDVQGYSRKVEPKNEIYLDAPSIDFRLRFPVPDLRPIHDPQRVPWWRRNIRPDFVLVKLLQARASVALSPHPLYDISANEIQIFYHESEMKHDCVNIGKAVMTDNVGSKFNDQKQEPAGVEYPRIVIEIPSDAQIQKLQQHTTQSKCENRCRGNYEESDSDPTSGESFGVTTGKSKEDTPFSAKRVCRESDTPHTKASVDDPETLTLPGDKDELYRFCQAAMELSKLQIRIELPVVSLQLKSKHLYEVIYNRISTDLLLWSPSAPAATAAAEASANLSASKVAFQEPPFSLANMGMMDSIYAPFTMCQSAIQLDSSSSTNNSESESDSDGIFYSVYDRNSRYLAGQIDESGSEITDQLKPQHPNLHNSRRHHLQKQRKSSFVDRSNAISFQLNIGQGMLTMFAPVRDAQNHVIPGQLGEFIVKLQSTYVFSVNGFHGNSNLGYLCIQGKAADIYHCGLIPTPASNPPLRLVNSVLPAYIFSTLYPTPKNLTLNEQRGCANREMFSLAIQIKAVPEQSIKRIRMAAGIQLTTLRHHSTLPQHSWLTQLLDMFDVVDYPVQGYTPFGVVTEMHLHLWDCAIDYRPLYFPFRAIITIGSFMISSNITTESSGLTLRFIAEDAALCLAPQIASLVPVANEKDTHRKTSSSTAGNRDDNKVTVLPSNELVCLVEVGLFEISLRLNEKATSCFPKFDLRTAMNDIHVRTCADSGRALAQLIGYLAAEGDLLAQDDGASDTESNESAVGLPMSSELEGNLVPVKPNPAPEVTPKQQQRVNTLMAEAMEESLFIQNSTSDSSREDQLLADGEGVEVFFFPDEDQNRVASRTKMVNNLISDHSNKRRFASDDDSLSIEEGSSVPSSFQDDNFYLKQRQLDERSDDTGSVNTEMRELLNFECSVMGLEKERDEEDEVVEALPQVTMDLGDVNKFDRSSSKHISNMSKNEPRKVSSDTDDDFCFIADEERPHCGNQEVPVLEEPIRIIDNHFSVPTGKHDLLLAPKEFPMAVTRYTICEMSITWHLYGGHDFLTEEERKKSRPKKSHSEHSFAHLPMSEAYKSGVSYSKGSPSVSFGPTLSQKLTWKSRGGPERRHDVMMEVQVNKVKFSHEVYPTNTEQASRQVLLITELEIWDRLAVSDIKKFLYQYSVGGQRTSKGNNHMMVIKSLHIRPNPTLPAQECCLRISVQPIRLNIDQDSLLFMVNFFNQLGGGGDLNEYAGQYHQTTGRANQTTTSHQQPVMMVELPDAAQELQARKMVSENLMLLIDEDEKNKEQQDTNSEVGDDTPPIYFRNIIFSPDVPIRIDYHGKRVELSHGPLAGLLMGLGQLQCSEIRLKKISHRHGILGMDRLLNFLLQEWLQDIKKKQLPKILGGVGPMYSLVQLFQGIWDLFWLPIEQYQKDGRIVRGLQRGAQSFTARTALAALEITTRIIHLLQVTAETAYDMVSPGPSVRRGRGNKKGKRKRLHPPQDIREGMTNALQIVKEGISDTAHNLVELTALEHDQKGYTGAVGAVMRQIPPMVVQPLVLATQATSNVLGGVKNQLVPDARAEAREKYKDDVE
ncbi:autophagy-related protein 2 homolog A [Malaya genurostris]|uniref:autophagy-related protein 2 homolog A n=1 Tax=Malaya genurostris TaxID=325434 RepID=UPI0026F3A8D8|nr:autophagy-related protein 2 homolog A [Malaya genurostris]XP_058467737.1 autophagy-related protein 2 homolog A [Malaya genurostris]XP_058467738.1 autophagy-related protein 2 homolog A [Malaya genurostris]XP_058467739.1 autophagy-related protein 2 homolog A [Malaya genurostris]XP_058467740.1 autophagy-related protein 2 homolog A [Malaya genurostris]